MPVSIHVGKPGVGKCLGGAFTKAFESLVKTVQGITAELQAERSEAKKEREEAKDREVRLNTQLRELRNEVSDLKGEIELLKERCISAQTESRTHSTQDKKIKKKSVPSLSRDHTEIDRKNSKGQAGPWADVNESESESDSNVSQGPSSSLSISRGKHGQGPNREAEKETKRSINGTKCTKVQSGAEQGTNGTKHARATQPKPKFDPIYSEDETWKLVLEKKPLPPKAVLYVGKLSPKTTEESLEKFITERSKSVGVDTPRIFNSRMYANQKEENDDGIGARITIPKEAVPILTSRSFWPRPAYARLWKFPPPAKHANLAETHPDKPANPEETPSDKPANLEEAGLQPAPDSPRIDDNAAEKEEKGSAA